MKPGLLSCLFFGLVSLAQTAAAQISLPPNPGQFSKRNLGESGGGGSSVGVSGGQETASKTVVIQYVAVTPVESWVNVEGKTIEARLLAFSAPEAGKSGPVEIIRDGRVRFLVSGRKEPVEYPLEQLGEAEKTRIKSLAELALKGPHAP